MLIAGLGNPGVQYENTRHNVGFWAIDRLAEKFRADVSIKQHKSLTGDFSFRGSHHKLIKPQTYMNLSGEAISGLLAQEKVSPSQLIVIVDDINLPVGKVRLRASGSDGGHNGLKSIISHIGKKFWRLRVGVGQPLASDESHEKIVSHVLGEVSAAEIKILEKVIVDVPEIIVMCIMGMGGKAMTKFNCLDYTKIKHQ